MGQGRMSADLLAAFDQALRGCTCKVARRETDWVFDFGRRRHITVDSPWRIISGGRLAFADEDDGQAFGLPRRVDGQARANSLLKARRVQAVQIDRVTADICIQLDKGVRLDVFHNSMGYEGWQAVFPLGDQTIQLIGLGGGDVAVCRYETASPPLTMTSQILPRP